MKPRILLTILVLVFSTLAWSQESQRTEDSTTNDQSPTNEESAPELELPYSQLLVPPMPVSALQMPLAFTSEIPRSNFLHQHAGAMRAQRA